MVCAVSALVVGGMCVCSLCVCVLCVCACVHVPCLYATYLSLVCLIVPVEKLVFGLEWDFHTYLFEKQLMTQYKSTETPLTFTMTQTGSSRLAKKPHYIY